MHNNKYIIKVMNNNYQGDAYYFPTNYNNLRPD